MRERPRLLFLTWVFRPHCLSQRGWNMAKYLSRLGWEVTVVTPDPVILHGLPMPPEVADAIRQEGIHHVMTGHSLMWLVRNTAHTRLGRTFQRVGRKTVELFLRVERSIGWRLHVERATRHLTRDDVDVILASAGPYHAFSQAAEIARRLGRPYVMDYRDLWTNNPFSTRLSGPRYVRAEEQLLGGTAAVTVVSPSMADAIQARFACAPRPHVVYNGYDPEELDPIPPHKFGHFAIVYAGRFYPPKSAISPVMAALRHLDALRPARGNWRFHYYGPNSNHVLASAEEFGVADRVVIHGPVPRAEALSALRGAAISVVITSVLDDATTEDKGILTGKIFDALGYGIPIILVAPPGSDAESILSSSGCGRRFLGSETKQMASYMVELMAPTAPKPAPARDYAWPATIGSLDAILRNAVRTPTPSCMVCAGAKEESMRRDGRL